MFSAEKITMCSPGEKPEEEGEMSSQVEEEGEMTPEAKEEVEIEGEVSEVVVEDYNSEEGESDDTAREPIIFPGQVGPPNYFFRFKGAWRGTKEWRKEFASDFLNRMTYQIEISHPLPRLPEEPLLLRIPRLPAAVAVKELYGDEATQDEPDPSALIVLPHCTYLRKTVIPLLLEALYYIATTKPQDPLTTMAAYLLKHNVPPKQEENVKDPLDHLRSTE